MSLEEWQAALRRQFGRTQKFRYENRGTDPVFSTFEVTNPETRRTYQVTIRGESAGWNTCTCPDFMTNTLGTCKHVEFMLAQLRESDARVLQAPKGPAYSEILLRYGGKRQVLFREGSQIPSSVRRLLPRFFDDDGILRPHAALRLEELLRAATAAEHEIRSAPEVLSFLAELRDADLRARRLASYAGATLDDLLKTRLYPYQREGVLFAARAGRAIIADEMGLGKTLQAIAASELLAREFGVEKVLIVSPTSLKYQWNREIEKFCSRSAQVIEGLSPRRRRQYENPSFFNITNYEALYRDLDVVEKFAPDLVILDEAQRIKNWKTRTAQSVKRIVSPYAIVLTGTPLENRLEDLHSIVEFVDRFRLGPLFRFLAEHQVQQEGKVVGYRNLKRISETLQPILVRRTKQEVLSELPPRLDKNFFVPMTPQQKNLHDENREVVARIVAKWKRLRFLSEVDHRRLMIALQNMRMACDSTWLLDGKTRFGSKIDELSTLLGEIFEDPEAKVVVFSQWKRMTDLAAEAFDRRGWGYVDFHGGVPSKERGALLRRFREDADCRVFLSTDAGGVGLNLQSASVVVNLDLPWNPAVLEQRIGRIHRLGQHRPVRVVNFISQGTIEEGMLQVLAFKKSLFAGVLDGGQDSVFMGGTRLKRFMESVEKATEGIPVAAPPSEPAAPPAAGPSDLGETLAAGARFLQGLGRLFAANGGPSVEKDARSGGLSLRLPMPDPATAESALKLVESFAALLRGAVPTTA